MLRTISFGFLALALCLIAITQTNAANKSAVILASGSYVEARTCDVWTGPCFANADFNLGGKHGVLAWRIDKGQAGDVSLDGLSVVVVVAAANTLGLDQTSPGKAVVIVDSKASAAQREALIRFAQQQGGKLVGNIVKVHVQPIAINGCPCKSNSCFEVDAKIAKVKTRCLDNDHDKVCGNEYAFYPPLTRNLNARPAAVVEHAFRGAGLGETYSDSDRRGAYVGTFEVK